MAQQEYWCLPGDNTTPVIEAKNHVISEHSGTPITLPPTCVLFFIGRGTQLLQEQYRAVTLCEKLPRFLQGVPVYGVEGHPNVCFVDGGRGAPHAVDTVETVHALGAQQILLVGMCGVYQDGLTVGDVLIPKMALPEEGTSRHYYPEPGWALPDAELHANAVDVLSRPFNVDTRPIVTTDSVYRQTLQKEASWRAQGCVGVEMESSAVLHVSRYLGMRAVSVLLASDAHPTGNGQPVEWEWGLHKLATHRDDFLRACIDLSITL